MLEEMHLRGLGVIDDAVLEFGPGLTVVTGETGAGKTMVVTGLGLLMGGKSDAAMVREGYASSLVEGRISIDPQGPAAARAMEAGADLDDEVLMIARTVPADGRGRAHLGGRSVPVGVLGELAGDLVAVHGQSDQIRLQSLTRQREALDRFAGSPLVKALTAYRETFQSLRLVEARLKDITERARERSEEAERLRVGLDEVEKIAPQPGEDVELRAEAVRLSHAESLQQAAGTAAMLLTGDSGTGDGGGGNVVALVSAVRRSLEGAAENDPALGKLGERAAEIGYLVDDLASECASYASSVESDPARLAAVEERRAILTQLVRTRALENVDAVLDWAQQASLRLLELDSDTSSIDELTAEVAGLRATLGERAAKLSASRSGAAAKLAKAVTGELQELSMAGAKLVVEVRHRADPGGLPVDLGEGPQPLAFGPDGVDDVELLLAPHPGSVPRPLGKGASGGELSRVMLGLEVVLGAVDPVPTFVFDEVDAGVGGRAALGIGRRLARLARTSQVLVVTHLPQVAAFADQHLMVRKRKHGGVEDSGSAQAHAEELLHLAQDDRAPA